MCIRDRKIYEDQLLQYYTPQLGKGNWLGDINSENDALPAICSYANSSIKMGDVLTGEILDLSLIHILGQNLLRTVPAGFRFRPAQVLDQVEKWTPAISPFFSA